MGAKLSTAKNLAKKTASFMYFLQDRIVILNVQDLYFPYIFQKKLPESVFIHLGLSRRTWGTFYKPGGGGGDANKRLSKLLWNWYNNRPHRIEGKCKR